MSKRSTRRRTRQTRRPLPRLKLRLDRRAWLALAAVALLLALPPSRRVLVRVADAAVHAIADARAGEAREREIARYAARYGISREMADAIERAARAERVETELAFRLVRVESAFNPRAVSPVGAVGLTQLMLPTARELQPGITRARLFHRDTNLRLGFRYFRRLLRQYDGDVEEALHAYNRGMGTVARIRRAGGDPANGYADKVLGETGGSPVGPTSTDTAVADSITTRLDGLAPVRTPAGM
ncbi:MAG TPA: transglycosylase SLT domain-containing protein [Longimicrobium sp.]|nr:transglycosylase SLT domain-containing protein [Longimicrobium sp.]